MKVLFLGEYSGVFMELSKGLNRLGVETFRISSGDSFKKYSADYLINFKKTNRLNSVLSSFMGFSHFFCFIRIWPELKSKINDYDIVQLINPRFFPFGDLINMYILYYVSKHNGRIFLSVLGDDYYVDKWNYKYNNKMPLYASRSLKKQLSKQGLWGKLLTDYCLAKCSGIIPGAMYYKFPYQWSSKLCSVIPFACDEKLIGTPFVIKDSEPVFIFHGWQKGKESRKGNDVFDRVLRKVADKYGDKVIYKVVQNVPFDEYQNMYKSCHIFIDQLYAYDKGTNGMYGMAAGKVVFSGFQKECLEAYSHYHGNEIGVAASLNEDVLYDQFCSIIEDRKRMESISINAILFVRENHEATVVARQLMNIWNGLTCEQSK